MLVNANAVIFDWTQHSTDF